MPETKPETKVTTFRSAVLTIQGDVDYDALPDKLTYFAYGKEIAPTTGQPHLQAFGYASKPMRLTQWKKIFPGAHIEQMRGSFVQNEKYCSKQSELIEFGQKPMHDGKRRSDLLVKDEIDKDPSKSMEQIYDETELLPALTYKTAFNGYREYKRFKTIKDDNSAPVVTYVYGAARSGKTRWVRETEPDLYDVPPSSTGGQFKWFNGYQGQEAVLFDNLNMSTEGKLLFLRAIDRYPIQVEIKGGFTWWKPKRIYITSIFSAELMATKFDDPQELLGRITVYKNI